MKILVLKIFFPVILFASFHFLQASSNADNIEGYDWNGVVDTGEYGPQPGLPIQNSSSRLSEEEKMRIAKERSKERRERLKNRTPTQMVREVYGQNMVDKYDTNKDGTLSQDEHASFVANLRAEGKARSIVIMSWYDKNNDGVIDEKERKKVQEDEKSGKLNIANLDREAKIILSKSNAVFTIQNNNFETNKVSPAALYIMNSKNQHFPPPEETMNRLFKSDKQYLISNLRKGTRMTNKMLTIWALTFLGGSDVRNEFQSILNKNYHGKKFTFDEVEVFGLIIKCLGHLAWDDDQSYNYLIDLLRPEGWTKTRTWKLSDPVIKDCDYYLIMWTIHALGLSGREEAREYISRMKEYGSKEFLKEVSAPIVTANFYLTLSKKYNKREYILFHATTDFFKELQEWLKTEEGSRLYNWRQEVR